MNESHRELLTDQGIISDLLKYEDRKFSNAEEHRFTFIIPYAALAIVLGRLLDSWIVFGVIMLIPVYNFYRLILIWQEKRRRRQSIKNGGFTVITDKLTHIGEEQIYEPHAGRRSAHFSKVVTFFYFPSGQWRVPSIYRHYSWSKNCHLSGEGLMNTSVPENEFYLVLVNNQTEVGYVYNKKLFRYEKEGAPHESEL
ncbi:MAG: hypothetical protein E7620_01120 [Ruminococcaceae bacterium]|nr:hypothetical protein [Oscillospiraceae bacterium]